MIKTFQKLFEEELCNDLPTTFWERKKHEISLPYEKTFHESQIPMKPKPIQMNKELFIYCQNEIQDLLKKI